MKVKNCTLIKAVTCPENAKIVDVAKKLKEHLNKRAIVVDAGGKPVGILSTTDICSKVVAEGLDAKEVETKDVMSDPFLIADMDDDLGAIFEKMREHTTFFVPVIESGKLKGILTYGELMFRVKEAIKNA
jgi:CBS domain-containing protein